MKNLFFLIFILAPSILKGQSHSFSQFFSAPLALNPALNGSASTQFRFTSNFRNQWLYGGTPYLTGSVGVETKVLSNSIPEYHSWGVGASVIVDQSNAGGLTYTISSLGTAYHIALDGAGTHKIGLGFQGSYNQRNINLNRLNFESQFGSGGFNGAIPIGETFQNLTKSYMDVHAGLLYQFNGSDVQFIVGGALYNILEPKVSATLWDYRLPRRYVFHSGVNIGLGESFGMMGSITGMSMSGLNNITAGLAFRKELETASFMAGCWYRLGDAAIPYIGFEKNGMTLGLSFDNTISGLRTIAQTRNAFELAIMFTPMGDYNNKKRLIPWY